VRRGHIAIACSQGFADHILPREVEAYRTQFPLVSFYVQVRDHLPGVEALTSYEADLALLIEPPPAPDMDILFNGNVPLCALMRRDHPLAEIGPVRLRDCLRHPIGMPDRSLAIRVPLDVALARARAVPVVAVESNSLELMRNHTLRENIISFQVSVGVPILPELCVRPIDPRDMPPIRIVLGQLRGRTLPIASAKFADQLARSLATL
jgi:DNA-binding transcriptional LysR family regulator